MRHAPRFAPACAVRSGVARSGIVAPNTAAPNTVVRCVQAEAERNATIEKTNATDFKNDSQVIKLLLLGAGACSSAPLVVLALR